MCQSAVRIPCYKTMENHIKRLTLIVTLLCLHIHAVDWTKRNTAPFVRVCWARIETSKKEKLRNAQDWRQMHELI
jgi:hypothetical protein